MALMCYMPLTISDEQLQQAGLSEAEAKIEFACRLFQAGRLDLWPAAQLAGLSRVAMEAELRARSIPLYRPSVDDFRQDMATLAALDQRKGS